MRVQARGRRPTPRSWCHKVMWLLLLSLAIFAERASSEDETSPPQKTPDDYLVKGLEDIEPSYKHFKGRMYAGVIPVDEENHPEEGFMFWMFVPDQQKKGDTMVLWLNGGPGCSSFLGGVFLENSPVTLGPRPPGTCCLQNDAPLRYFPHHWALATTMLYVEQPAGVGFSTGREPQNEKEVGWDFYHFLVNFYKVFEDLQPHRLTIFGESYAGMFVPAIAHRIFKENQNSPELHIHLDGIALGNGWMNGRVQGPMAIDYAWYHGMIDAYTRDAFHAQWEHCTTSDGVNMTGEIQSAPFHPFTTPDECGVMDAVLQAAGAGNLPHGLSPNKYDVTTFDPLNIVSSHDSTVAQFMNNPDVKKALNAPEGITWSGCMPDAGRRRRLAAMLNDDKPVSVVPYVAELLDNSDVRVLVYNGDLDMACNAQGSETLLNDMKWSGHEAWKVAGRGIWILQQDETIAGYVKSFSNLMFLVVKNSGHLVPYNQPAQGLELVERFLEKRPFIDIPLPSFVISIPTAPPGEEHDEDDDFDFDLNSNSDQFNAYNKASSFTTSKWVIQQLIFAVVCFLAGAILSRSWRTRTGYESVS